MFVYCVLSIATDIEPRAVSLPHYLQRPRERFERREVPCGEQVRSELYDIVSYRKAVSFRLLKTSSLNFNDPQACAERYFLFHWLFWFVLYAMDYRSVPFSWIVLRTASAQTEI